MKYILIIFSLYGNSVTPVTATFADREHCQQAAKFIMTDLRLLDNQKYHAVCFDRGL